VWRSQSRLRDVILETPTPTALSQALLTLLFSFTLHIAPIDFTSNFTSNQQKSIYNPDSKLLEEHTTAEMSANGYYQGQQAPQYPQQRYVASTVLNQTTMRTVSVIVLKSLLDRERALLFDPVANTMNTVMANRRVVTAALPNNTAHPRDSRCTTVLPKDSNKCSTSKRRSRNRRRTGDV
jgi:hypothetical protein